MNNPDLRENLIPSNDHSDEGKTAWLDQTGRLEEDPANESRQIGTTSMSTHSMLRKSILKTTSEKRIRDKRISFHDNLQEVHEVENWRQYNKVKKTCLQTCWDECSLI